MIKYKMKGMSKMIINQQKSIKKGLEGEWQGIVNTYLRIIRE